MSKKVKEIIELLEADGWYFKRLGKGSHMIYRHSTKPGIVVVPSHEQRVEIWNGRGHFKTSWP